MATTQNYYISDSTNKKIVHVTDDGSSLTDTGTESAAGTSGFTAMCFDADSNIYAAEYSSGIRLWHFTRTTLATRQIDSQNYKQFVTSKTAQGLLHYNGKVYVTYDNDTNDYNFAIFTEDGATIEYFLLGTGTQQLGKMILSGGSTEIYIQGGRNGERVHVYNIASKSVTSSFGTVTGLATNGLALCPDGSFLISSGNAAGLTANYDLDGTTNNWGSEIGLAADCGETLFLSGTTGVSCGDTVKTFTYTTGAVLATYTISATGIVRAAKNAWGDILTVGASNTDEDANGSYNTRVLTSDLSSNRKLNLNGGVQNSAVLVYGAGINPVTSPPVDSRTVRQLIAIGNNEIWYESTAGTMSQLTTSDAIDTSIALTAGEAYQKIFVANDTKLKVCDFGNTLIETDNISAAEANAPNKSNILTGAGGATLIVDYITSVSGASKIYGKKLNSTVFVDGEAVTGTNDDGNAVSFNIKGGTTQTAPPHYYGWTVYGGSTTYGAAPDRATLVCNYRGRLVLSGDAEYPHQWYMSRQANPWDWAYLKNDAQSPVAGSDADAGEIGDVIVSLSPNKDDYLIMGCVNSIWVLRGDPAAGGSLDEISLTTGMFGPMSFCWDSRDNFYFFGSNGICRIPPSLGGVENLSITVLPNIISDLGVSPTTHRITLGYDREREGVVISITTLSTGSNSNYFFDIVTNGFFPESYPVTCGIFSQHYYQADDEDYRKLIVGCADGYLRFFDDSTKNDDAGSAGSKAISSHATIGPLMLGKDADQRGRMKTISFTTSTDTDGLTYDIHVADSAEEVVDDSISGATPLHTGTISAGNRVKTTRPRARGAWMGVKLENTTAAESWQFEKLVADITPAGDIK
jgi:hypothetical protein